MADESRMTWTILRKKAGFLAGYGQDTTAWTDGTGGTEDQAGNVQFALDCGYRECLYSAIRGDGIPHVWSFLRKQGTLTTVADDYDYDLPTDFANLVGDLVFPASTGYFPPAQIPESDLLALRSMDIVSNVPEAYAIRNKAQAGAAGQRWELLLHRPPNAVWVMLYQYDVEVPMLSTSAPYPLGPINFQQLVYHAVLACVERDLLRTPGVHMQAYAGMLPTVIQSDRMMGPRNLGYMGSGRSERFLQRNQGTVVTYDGVHYTGD